MKTKHFFLLLASMLLAACSTGDGGDEVYEMGEKSGDAYSMGGAASDGGEGGELSAGDPQGDNTQAGVVTAGEWNDLDHWSFWSGLMLAGNYADKSDYWKCYTNHRVPVTVADAGGQPKAGVRIKLVRVGDAEPVSLWESVTDNHGRADCWLSTWQKSTTVDAASLRIVIDGHLVDQAPMVCDWDSLGQLTMNNYLLEAPANSVKPQADIAFVVDATGSMSDEIDFLKSDLLDIIGKAAARRPEQTIRTAALFYRDEGDAYLTRHADFTVNTEATTDFVGKQRADGGGDYPEAVHTALERMLQDLSWSEEARTRIVFLILDAPAHHEQGVISSLQQSLAACARQGIKIVPVAASGVDKNTEFMLRFFATLTGGTYVFLTNDSGVGLDHIEATVGDYEVELLNELLIRLIDYYTE